MVEAGRVSAYLVSRVLGAGSLGMANPSFPPFLTSARGVSGARDVTSTRVPVPGSLSFPEPTVGVNGLLMLGTLALIDSVRCGLRGGLGVGSGGGTSTTGVGGR